MVKKRVNRAITASEPVKASFWFTICSIVNKCIQFITVPIFTRLLSTTEYGQYSIFVSWQSILIIFATLNLYSNVFNNGLLKYRDDRARFLSSLQGLTTTITLFLIGVILLLNKQISKWIGLPTYIIIMIMIEIMMMSGYEFWAASERFDYKFRNIIKVTLLVAVLNPIIGLIFVSFSEEKGYARIISVLLVQIMVYGILYFRNIFKNRTFYKRNYWKYALILAIPLVPHYLSQILLNQMDRIMISNICGIDKAGIYSVAYSAAMILQIVGKAIQSSFTPWIYKKIEANDVPVIKPIVNALILIVGALNFALICFAPEAILILGGVKYQEAIYVIPPVVCSCYLIFVYSMFCTIEFYFEKAKAMTMVSVIGALLNYITNAIFIRQFGYYAAGYTTLFCYICFTLSHYFVMKKALTDNGHNKNLFDMKFISIFTIVYVGGTIVMVFVYEYITLRYSIILLIGLLAIMKRNHFLSIMRQRR